MSIHSRKTAADGAVRAGNDRYLVHQDERDPMKWVIFDKQARPSRVIATGFTSQAAALRHLKVITCDKPLPYVMRRSLAVLGAPEDSRPIKIHRVRTGDNIGDE